MIRMRSQIGVNSVAINNDVSVTGSGISKTILSSMMMMAGFQVREYQKSLPEIVTYIQIIPPIMMVKSDIIVPLIVIVTPILIVLVITFESCHQQKNYAQFLHYSMS